MKITINSKLDSSFAYCLKFSCCLLFLQLLITVSLPKTFFYAPFNILILMKPNIGDSNLRFCLHRFNIVLVCASNTSLLILSPSFSSSLPANITSALWPGLASCRSKSVSCLLTWHCGLWNLVILMDFSAVEGWARKSMLNSLWIWFAR